MEGIRNCFPGIKEKLELLVTPSKSRDLEDPINCANSRAGSLRLGTTDIGGFHPLDAGNMFPTSCNQKCLQMLLWCVLEGRGTNHLQLRIPELQQMDMNFGFRFAISPSVKWE